ncbi:52 kDa repressor of the inhibitor of the protein kinase-like [Mercenaria mercenaria]|uniref:52 kDa repressor of the inhibitor of the protein kinase-like n=1 Tax=Mercenaria mercenaria TaxID=6596 RepID=UPI00234F02B5|nr:52 kDa repressor of the inhibitor of the protein kinase-like [Mercenaria mercenaria]
MSSRKPPRPLPGQKSIFQCFKTPNSTPDDSESSSTVPADNSQSFSGDNTKSSPKESTSSPKQFQADHCQNDGYSAGCSLGARFLDIGTIDVTRRLRMSDSMKMSTLISRFEPSRSWVKPKSTHGKSGAARRVPDLVFDTVNYPYLSFAGKKQNIAFRGKTEEKSNFRALINYRAEVDSDLHDHLANSPKHAQYLSPSIQNEFIHICGNQISDSIVHRCQDARYFSILADESADVSNTEQFAFCLRYIERQSSGKHVLHEDFLSFVQTTETTGETLHQLLLDEIHKHNLNPNFIVGQGYDGAGNMSGCHRGVQARFSAEFPNAKYIHCRNHRLNLAICHACRVAFVQSMFTVVGDVLFFITSSPKRLGVYSSHNDDGEALKKFCPTRWSQHSESITAFYTHFKSIVETLTDLQVGMDTKTMSTASSLQKAVLSFDFVVALCCVSGPLDTLNPLTDSMQDPQCDLVKAAQHAKVLHGLLAERRNDIGYFGGLWEKAVALATAHDINVCQPRVAARQQHRNNIAAETPKEYWRLNMFVPFMDHLLSQLHDRLCLSTTRLNAQYLLPTKLRQLSPEMWADIKQEYSPFIDCQAIDTELDVWKRVAADSPIQGLAEAVDETYQLYPNIHVVLKILLTMPVSTASAERSFSSLRRLKTYLRNTMTEERLTGLALMHIHRNHQIDIDQDSDQVKNLSGMVKVSSNIRPPSYLEPSQGLDIGLKR